MYEAIIFDVDGVLLRRHKDYPDVYRDAIFEAFRTFDVNPPDSDVEAFYGGESKTLDGMREVCERHGIKFEEFWQEREAQSSELQKRMIEGGERDLYEDCTIISTLAESHDLGVVSSNQQDTIEYMLDHFDFTEYFKAVYGRNPTVAGYQRTKPDVYYLERALEDLGTRSALYVCDGASDVTAADQAGLDSAFVWREHRKGYELPESPTYEIDHLTELTSLV